MDKIGVFGGTFNPIHNGHLNLAMNALKEFNLKKIFFIPTYISPHKCIEDHVSSNDRLQMCKIATANYKNFEVLDIEVARKGISYTVDTLISLKKMFPTDQLFLIMGQDSFFDILSWKEYKKIFTLCTLLVMRRDTTDYLSLKNQMDILSNLGASVNFLNAEKYTVSSTAIRNKIKENRNVLDLIPLKVWSYINENELYAGKEKFMYNIEELKKILRKNLGEKRYLHCLNVAKESVHLAQKYGANQQKAEVAGLLHDITKEFSEKEHMEIMNKYGEKFSGIEESAEKLWHAVTGYVFIKNELGITDPDILNAVRFHTTGRASMSLLEKIVLVADFISEDRSYDGVEKIRESVKISLDNAIFDGMTITIGFLLEQGVKIALETVMAYNEAIDNMKI